MVRLEEVTLHCQDSTEIGAVEAVLCFGDERRDISSITDRSPYHDALPVSLSCCIFRMCSFSTAGLASLDYTA